MPRRATARTVALAATALLAAGCGSSGGGSAKPADPHAALFDPCTTVPASAITQIGADPDTADPNSDLVAGPAWRVCAWRGPWFELTVYATTHTVQEAKQAIHLAGFTPVDLPGRDALSFAQEGAPPGTQCFIDYPFSEGSIQIEIDSAQANGNAPLPVPPCTKALDAAKTLDPYLPH